MSDITVQIGGWDLDQLEQRICRHIEEQTTKVVREAVDQAIEAEIRAIISERVGDLVGQAFTQPFQKTNEWGEPTGKPIAIRALVVEQANKSLDEKVRRDDGRPAGYRDQGITRREWLILKSVKSLIHETLTPMLEEIQADARAKLDRAGRVKIAEAMANLLQDS